MSIKQDYNRSLILFILKDAFSLFIVQVDFVLRLKDNLCLLALSWLEIKHKTKLSKRKISSISIDKIYKEKVIKTKIVNLQTKKMNKAVEENTLKIMITRLKWEFNLK